MTDMNDDKLRPIDIDSIDISIGRVAVLVAVIGLLVLGDAQTPVFTGMRVHAN